MVTADGLAAGVATEIRAMLARRRISAAELARRLGVTQSYVARRMIGVQPIDLDELERIASILGVTVVDLIPRDRRETTSPYLPQPISRPPNVPNQRRPVSRRPPAGPGRTSRIAA